jgi:hypothetical protein
MNLARTKLRVALVVGPLSLAACGSALIACDELVVKPSRVASDPCPDGFVLRDGKCAFYGADGVARDGGR